MAGIPTLIYIFLQKYLVPFLFAIGLFYFIYGVIEYFIIGSGGDEERAQHGRELFLKSIGWFVLAIVAHLVVLAFGWLLVMDFSVPAGGLPSGGAGVDVERGTGVLQVPDVPTR